MEEGFKSIDEILEEVAKEEKMTKSEIRDLWNHQKIYTQKQMDKEGVYAIFLPFIGTLSLNIKQYTKELRRKKRNVYKTLTNKVIKLKEHENFSKHSNSHKRVIGVNRLTRYIINHYHTGLHKSKKILKHEKCWDVITKYSNGVFKKREEPLTNKNKYEQIKRDN